MKVFTAKQIRQIDDFTIKNEPILSFQLMTRAAAQIFDWISARFGIERHFKIFAGQGNNGGDALVLAHMLSEANYKVDVFIVKLSDRFSEDCKTAYERLLLQRKVKPQFISDLHLMPPIKKTDIVIDGIFGSGLSRPLEGFAADVVHLINQSGSHVISIDIPSGMFSEDNGSQREKDVVKASYTLSLQFPKLSFFFPDSGAFTGEFYILNIGLHQDIIDSLPTPFNTIDTELIAPLIRKRDKFTHKGSFGHTLIVGGSYGKMGAAVLASRAAIRAGAGLVTAHVPQSGYQVIQCSVPEALVSIDQSEVIFTDCLDIDKYSAIAVGPGIGVKSNTKNGLLRIIEEANSPLVLDADALNILSEEKDWLSKLPENTILTPHPGEFKRLAGETANGYERLMKQIELAKNYKIIVVLKDAYTSVALPDESAYFNTSGNAGMATGGSGDVLTGIIASLAGQGFSPANAALTGVYLHGLAGDLAAADVSEEALAAGDLTRYLGKAFLKIKCEQ